MPIHKRKLYGVMRHKLQRVCDVKKHGMEEGTCRMLRWELRWRIVRVMRNENGSNAATVVLYQGPRALFGVRLRL